MKKVILAMAVVSVSFAACNSGDKTPETPKTDTPVVVVPVDTAKPVVVDTVKPVVVDTAAKK